jgi:hypothetical protein
MIKKTTFLCLIFKCSIDYVFMFFSSKGDATIHNEISVFVYRYDLKQSQIARMAGRRYIHPYNYHICITILISGVNQAYVSKFLRGDLFDLSENGRMAICRWYLRYKKIVQCMGENISLDVIH